jgi:hypothetical protein
MPGKLAIAIPGFNLGRDDYFEVFVDFRSPSNRMPNYVQKKAKADSFHSLHSSTSIKYPTIRHNIVMCLVTRHWNWIGNWIYWTLKIRNYKSCHVFVCLPTGQ